jgi:chromate transporter
MPPSTTPTESAPGAGVKGEARARTSLRELGLLFLRLGATAFGGPAAHIAMMQDEVVRRREWLSEERFLDLLGATNLIPGPNSTEMAMHIGMQRRGAVGLLVAGVCFISPAMLITGLIASIYVRYGTVPAAAWLLYGVKPVIIGVVLQAICSLTPKAARTTRLRVLAACAVLLSALKVNELALLLAAGLVSVALTYARPPGARANDAHSKQFLPILPAVVGAAGTTPIGVTLPGLFGVFFKIGSVLFGSGYVLLAFLRADLVQRLGWLSEAQLIDSVAVGQVTPGPVFTTATFIGYLLAGPSGALVATVGIFLPAFILVALSGPLVPRLRASALAGAFLDGVNVASLALMATVTVQLGWAALVDVWTVLFALVAAVLLVRFKVNSAWLVLGGAATGWCVHALALAH